MNSQTFPRFGAPPNNNANFNSAFHQHPPLPMQHGGPPPNPNFNSPHVNVNNSMGSNNAIQLPLSLNQVNNPITQTNIGPPFNISNQIPPNYRQPFAFAPPPFPNNLPSRLLPPPSNITSTPHSYQPSSNNSQFPQQTSELNVCQQSNMTNLIRNNYQIPSPSVAPMIQNSATPSHVENLYRFQVCQNVPISNLLQNKGQNCNVNNLQTIPPALSTSLNMPMQQNNVSDTFPQLPQMNNIPNIQPFSEASENIPLNIFKAVPPLTEKCVQFSQPINSQVLPPNMSSTNFSSFVSSNNVSTLIPPPMFDMNFSKTIPTPSVPITKQATVVCNEVSDEDLVKSFLTRVKLNPTLKKEKNPLTIGEFRCHLKSALDILSQLTIRKEALSKLLEADEETWIQKWNEVKDLKDKLSKVISKLSNIDSLSAVLQKLKRIAKKRNRIQIRKEHRKWLKLKHQQDCLESRKKLDQWLVTLREKDLSVKREVEMKKEADSILSEVRRKIQEARRVIEKLKIFQKLRQIRKENAVKKGMFVFSKHDKIFEKKVLELKEVMIKQLSDYEDEEKALKVMLETEQEGQLEEEEQWRIKQLRKRQENKFRNIEECLFGSLEPPLPTDPMYFFWQHYMAGNCDTSTLLKIRHYWDVFLVLKQSNEGSSIPQQWVTPDQPSSEIWAQAIDKDFTNR